MPGPVDPGAAAGCELVDGAFEGVTGAIRPEWDRGLSRAWSEAQSETSTAAPDCGVALAAHDGSIRATIYDLLIARRSHERSECAFSGLRAPRWRRGCRSAAAARSGRRTPAARRCRARRSASRIFRPIQSSPLKVSLERTATMRGTCTPLPSSMRRDVAAGGVGERRQHLGGRGHLARTRADWPGPTLTSAVSLPSVARHRPSSLASTVARHTPGSPASA